MRLSILVLILATQAASCFSSGFRAYRPGDRVGAQTRVKLTLNDGSEVVLRRAKVTDLSVTGVADSGGRRSIPIELVLEIQIASEGQSDTVAVVEAVAVVFAVLAGAVLFSGLTGPWTF